MRRGIIAPVILLACAAILVSCSGSKILPPTMPDVAGPWEFIAASTTNPGYSTGVEVALQEGQLFSGTTGVYNPTGQISAAAQQLAFVGINLEGKNQSIVFGGNCTPATSDAVNTLSGSISGLAGSMNFTFVEAGNTFNVSAILNPNGTSMVGTYTEQSAPAGQSNGVCNNNAGVNDQGTITGTLVSKLSGTYLGKICQPADSSCSSGAIDAATATLSESSGTLTVGMVLTGADNTTFTLTGPVAGNAFSVQGTFGGVAVSYSGYFQNTFDKSDGLYDIPTVYLANVNLNTSPPTPTYAGTLIVPQTP
jgi:hypothetical protein